MKKQFFVNSLVYFVAIFAACLVNVAVSALVLKILNLFIVVDYFIGAICCAIVAFIVVGGVVASLSFFESYKSVEFAPGRILGSVGLAGIYHLAISTLLGFYPFAAGGTRYLAGLISMGNKFDSLDRIVDIYLWEYLLAFGIYLVLEIIAAEVCGYLGKRRRIKIRESLDGFVAEAE